MRGYREVSSHFLYCSGNDFAVVVVNMLFVSCRDTACRVRKTHPESANHVMPTERMRRDISLQHTESIKNTKLCSLYFTAVFNLYTFVLYFHQVFLSCTLVAPKYTKRPAYVKNSRLLLLLMSCVATSLGRRKLATPILSVLSRVLRNSFRMAV